MRLCSIASGSSGNCIYIGSDETHILIDVGISCKRIVAGLSQLEVAPENVSGILITHEHSDHINGLAVMAKKFHIPIYTTRGTANAILAHKTIGKNLDTELFHLIKADEHYEIGDLNIHPMTISHDAAEPVAYRVSCGETKIGVATDIGVFTDYTIAGLQGMNAILLEANHDVNMLQVGPYPYYLKQRVLGNRGHLSNENSGRLLKQIAHENLQAVMLGHLSKENNLPELAYETVRVELMDSEMLGKTWDFPIYVAKRDEISEIINIA